MGSRKFASKAIQIVYISNQVIYALIGLTILN